MLFGSEEHTTQPLSAAQGSCECFAAFGGSDCSQCAEGYVQSGGTCSRYVRIRLPYIALQDRAASVNVRPVKDPGFDVSAQDFVTGYQGFTSMLNVLILSACYTIHLHIIQSSARCPRASWNEHASPRRFTASHSRTTLCKAGGKRRVRQGFAAGLPLQLVLITSVKAIRPQSIWATAHVPRTSPQQADDIEVVRRAPQIVLIIGIAMCVFGVLMLAVALLLARRLRQKGRRRRKSTRCTAVELSGPALSSAQPC